MAIPMSWPVHEEPEMDLVLEQLLIAMSQIVELRRIRRENIRMRNERRTEAEHEPMEASYLRQPQTRNGQRVSLHPLRVFYYDQEITPNIYQSSPTVPAPSATMPENAQPAVQLPLPDLLNDVNCRARKPHQPVAEMDPSASTSWAQTGAELRHIADDFEDMRTPTEENARTTREPKNFNLLSKLCPMVVSTVWPILAFVLRWNYFAKNR